MFNRQSHSMKLFTKQNILFILIFAVLGFLALQVPVAQLAGSKAKFTLFDAFGPLAGAFISSLPGVIAVFLMQLANFLAHGAKIIDVGAVIRFFPMFFAVLYFARKSKWIVAVPIIAIIAWNMNPIGRSVWYFSLYWLIPVACHFLRDRFLLARSLGATMTAHSVGGALWIWFFALPKAVWVALIPVVAAERLMFAVGITLMYLVVSNVLALLMKKRVLKLPFVIEEKYLVHFAK